MSEPRRRPLPGLALLFSVLAFGFAAAAGAAVPDPDDRTDGVHDEEGGKVDVGDEEAEIERRLEERERELTRQLELEVERHREELERHRSEAVAEVERQLRRGRHRGERGDRRVSFGTGLTLDEGRSARDVVVLLGSAVIHGDVRGSATAVGGSVEVDGEVSEDVVAVGGSVSLGPRARVRGDVVAVGGSVDRHPEAEVDGQVTEISVGPLSALQEWGSGWGSWWGWWPVGSLGMDELFGSSDSLVERIGSAVVLALLIACVVWAAPRRTAAIADRVELEPWKSLFTGITAEILYVSVLVFLVIFLAITIIGLPLACLLAIFGCVALVVAFVLGYGGSALAAGRRLEGRFELAQRAVWLTPLLGVALIQVWSILGKALGFLGGPLRWTALLVLLFGFAARYVAWTAGLGALVLHHLAPLPASVARQGLGRLEGRLLDDAPVLEPDGGQAAPPDASAVEGKETGQDP